MAGSGNMGNALSPGASSGTPGISMPGQAARLNADPMQGGSPLPPAPPSDASAPEGPLPDSQRADTSGPFGDAHAALNQSIAAYRVGQRAQDVLDHVRRELDNLMDMGDIIRPEDVVGAAGRLVGHGVGAQQLAQLLSSMPTMGGEGLASWVRMHDLTVRQTEANLAMENNMSRHRMGVAALRSMGADHVEHEYKKSIGTAAGPGPAHGTPAVTPPPSPSGASPSGASMPSMGSTLAVTSPSGEDSAGG